jgi:putative ABC transport system permease protein
MTLWRQVTRGTRALFDRRASDHDIADEVRGYVEEAAAIYERQGLTPTAAWRAAQLEIGNMTVAREQVRSYGWENIVGDFLVDLRYALRRLRKNPGFTIVAVGTLALGIGASTAIFSAVSPVLFEPLPYPHADRLISITDQQQDGAALPLTFGNFHELDARNHSFESLAAARPWQPVLLGLERPARLEGQAVSFSYFRTLGVTPLIGRDFASDDDRPGAAPVLVISDGLWRTRFASDSGIVGRRVNLDGELGTIIGVMPRGFTNVTSPEAEVWTPLRFAPSPPSDGPEWGHILRVIGRLRPAVPLEQARGDLATITSHPIGEFVRAPWSAMRRPLLETRLQDDLTRGVKPALLAVLGAVLLLLLIACVNVANLLLARASQRRGELAMRVALGADSGRLLRQLLTESTVLALIGGALGVLVARVGVSALVALSPADLPRRDAIGVSTAALIFAVLVSAAVGIATGLVPAIRSLRATRNDAQPGLQLGARRTTSGQQGARRSLVVAEVALAMVLLVSSGLLFRSLERVFSVDAGFKADHLLVMRVQLVSERFANPAAMLRYYANALEAVRRVPGVTSAGVTSQLPLSGDGDTYGVHFESTETQHDEGNVFRYAVSPDYFNTAGIPLVRGRMLDSTDRAGAPLVVLINESFARRKFPARDPIGQRVHVGPDRGPWFTIVGVVKDVKQLSLATHDADAVYLTPDQSWFADEVMWFVVRTRGEPSSLGTSVRNAIWSVDKDQPVDRLSSMDAIVAASETQRHFALVIFECFAVAALVLAAMGLYGVLAGSVAERVREIGVRAALGAAPGDIVRLVVGQGMVLTGIGIVFGVIGAAWASRALITLLFGVSRLDPATYGGVVVVLGGVAAVACLIPARRAARVDPVITLRAD